MARAEPAQVEELGLRQGEAVRFRRREGARWTIATVTGVERDGSLGLRDAAGRFRAIPLERVEVAVLRRGRQVGWEPLLARAARDEQLPLFGR